MASEDLQLHAILSVRYRICMHLRNYSPHLLNKWPVVRSTKTKVSLLNSISAVEGAFKSCLTTSLSAMKAQSSPCSYQPGSTTLSVRSKCACGNHQIKTVMLCYISWGKKPYCLKDVSLNGFQQVYSRVHSAKKRAQYWNLFSQYRLWSRIWEMLCRVIKQMTSKLNPFLTLSISQNVLHSLWCYLNRG